MHNLLIKIFSPQELNHSSYVQAGLYEWARKQRVGVRVKIVCSENRGTLKINQGQRCKSNKAQAKTSFYELQNLANGESILFACDLYDWDSEFSSIALEKCQYVFKRNYRTAIVEKLEQHHQLKLFPLGLTFGVRSRWQGEYFKYFLGLFCQNIRLAWKFDGYFFSRIYREMMKQWKHWKFIKTTRLLDRFDSFEPFCNAKILFQTRTFEETQSDVLEIHEQRYRLIRLLRKEFPDTFYGGFLPRGIAVEKYKDALSNVPSEPEEYLNFVKECDIVIYTRGLAHSPAWKMAEYLSQGKVIMAEPLTTELPAPLEHGVHVLYFHSESELIENINKVQADKELAKRLSENARTYFEEYVHPEKNMERILTFMMRKEGWIV